MGRLDDFITSLLQGPAQAPPDCLVDVRDAVDGLRCITANGRALVSTEANGMGVHVGRMLDSLVGDDRSVENLERVIISLALLHTLTLRAVHALDRTLLPEEVLMDAVSQDALMLLARDTAALPCGLPADGAAQVDWASLPLFHEPFSLTPAAVAAFIERRITGPLSENGTPHATHPTDEPLLFDIIDESEIEPGSEADPLDGFDDIIDLWDDVDGGDAGEGE